MASSLDAAERQTRSLSTPRPRSPAYTSSRGRVNYSWPARTRRGRATSTTRRRTSSAATPGPVRTWRTSPADRPRGLEDRHRSLPVRLGRPREQRARLRRERIIMADSTTFLDTAIGGNALAGHVHERHGRGHAREPADGGRRQASVTLSASDRRVDRPRAVDALSSFSSRGPRRGAPAEARHRGPGPDDLVAGPADGLPRPQPQRHVDGGAAHGRGDGAAEETCTRPGASRN